MLAFEGLGNISFLQAIDDLNLVDNLTVLKNLKAGTLDDQIILPPSHQLQCTDLSDEFCLWILLRIIRL